MALPIEGLVLLEDGARWVQLNNPVAIIEARRPGDVPSALQNIDTQVRTRGWHAVGFLRYEAGGAYGLAVSPHHPLDHDDLPLVRFALFEHEHVHVVGPPRANAFYEVGALEPSISRSAFLESFTKIRQHIADGDTYQVNFTFRLRGAFHGDPFSCFADLVATQRGHHAAFIRVGQRAICSASPELFFRHEHGRLVARPMKGTARRGLTPEEDGQLAARLQQSAKERAENVMVVDMVRNDVGRIATFGSVEVPSLFALEAYPNVWQMTSTVTGQTDASLEEIVAALFPSASVTGAPKVRTTQIIAALERRPRGVYTGAIGYLSPDGLRQFNVAIRTAVIDLVSGTLEFGVGSGIVWDSDPDREYDECLLKGSIVGRRPKSFELVETMRWTPEGGWLLLERHLARLEASAAYFAFPFDAASIRARLVATASSAGGPSRVRLLVSSDGRVRVEQTPLEQASASLRVRLGEQPIDRSDVLLYHKTTARDVYERARRPDCDDVILWNSQGEVTEATIANVIVAIEGRLVTPPVSCGLLPGTFRAELLASGEVAEEVVTLDRLRRADRLWLVNSVRGWSKAILVAD